MKKKKQIRKRSDFDSKIEQITDLTDNLAKKAEKKPTYAKLVHQLDRLIIDLKELLRGGNNESK